jgi:hypothetical protein
VTTRVDGVTSALEAMSPEQLRTLAAQLIERIGHNGQAIRLRISPT